MHGTDSRLDLDKPLIILIGHVDHEGVTSILRASHRQYIKKVLVSSLRNWRTLGYYAEKFKIAAVLVKVSAPMLKLLVSDGYRSVGEEVFSELSSYPNLVFVHEDIRAGFGYINGERVKSEDFEKGICLLEKAGLTVITYESNAEVTVMAESLIRDADRDLIIRFYVPAGRVGALETDRILSLFRDYLVNVVGASVRMDQRTSDTGTVYEFFGGEHLEGKDLETNLDEFAELMTLCAKNPKAAETILEEKGLKNSEVATVLRRYSKEYSRCSIDIKHERETKVLAIRQRLETELGELLPIQQMPLLFRLAESIVPSSFRLIPQMGEFAVQTEGNISIEIDQVIMDRAIGIITDEMSGDVKISPEDRQLIQLARKEGGQQSAELESAVHEISDAGLATGARLKAGKVLLRFLNGCAKVGTEVAAKSLAAYVEAKMSQ